MCEIEDCTGSVVALGLCDPHYRRWKKKGIRGGKIVRKGGSVEGRFWSQVDKSDGCWIWTGYVSENGYGVISVGSKDSAVKFYVHRFAYSLEHGEIPSGLTIDHLCHTNDTGCPGGETCPHRRCVNPDHLEVVSRGENSLRGGSPPARNATKVECPQGHPLSGENLYVCPAGQRRCRTCRAEQREAYRRSRAQASN